MPRRQPNAPVVGLALLTFPFLIGPLPAQLPAPVVPDGELVRVMVVGTFHFHQTDALDVRTPQNQAALDRVAERLVAFAPTRIAVECTADRQATLDARYAAYRDGSPLSGRNEIEQLGFRLARRIGLPGVLCVDAPHPPAPGFDSIPSWDAFRQAGEAHGETVAWERFVPMLSRRGEVLDSLMRSWPLERLMDVYNSPESVRYGLARMLLLESRVGTGRDWIGADWVARWQGRNVRIFANLQRHALPGDRMILLIGDGHKMALEQLLDASWEFEVLPVPRFGTVP